MKLPSRLGDAGRSLGVGIGIAAYTHYALGPQHWGAAYKLAILYSFGAVVVPSIITAFNSIKGPGQDD